MGDQTRNLESLPIRLVPLSFEPLQHLKHRLQISIEILYFSEMKVFIVALALIAVAAAHGSRGEKVNE